ncbi:hypothetical protein TELCIR_10961, partial [Teladorsagia circumcincta]
MAVLVTVLNKTGGKVTEVDAMHAIKADDVTRVELGCAKSGRISRKILPTNGMANPELPEYRLLVSSDILRVSGYTQQFRTLLTARFSPRRESTPNVHLDVEDDKTECNSKTYFWFLYSKHFLVISKGQASNIEIARRHDRLTAIGAKMNARCEVDW